MIHFRFVSLASFTTTKETSGFKAHGHIASVIKLMEYCENNQPDKPDYSTMSDEELLEIMRVTAN